MINRVYLYDGRMEHLYTLFFHLFRAGDVHIEQAGNQPSLFAAPSFASDPALSARVARYIATRGGASMPARFRRVFFSADPRKEDAMFDVFRLLEAFGGDAIAHPEAALFCSIEREVAHERHNYLGFLRFARTKDHILYASMRPKNDVLPLVLGHFHRRFGEDVWMIRDAGRNIAYQSDRRAFFSVHTEDLPEMSPENAALESLWGTFFRHISIDARRNPSLQTSHVPLRYREFLTEFSLDLQKTRG